MPTGYTADVQDGKITDFPTFAIRCARAMGATIMMRDDPLDAPIPEFEPSDHHIKRLAESRAELARVEAMSSADVVAACEEANRAARESYDKSVIRTTEVRNRYNAMLAQVVQWVPPTPEHEGLKKFMVEQLRESIRFDCSEREPPVPQSPADWRADRIASLRRDIEYHEKHDAEERERTAARNEWVRQLRLSLAVSPSS